MTCVAGSGGSAAAANDGASPMTPASARTNSRVQSLRHMPSTFRLAPPEVNAAHAPVKPRLDIAARGVRGAGLGLIGLKRVLIGASSQRSELTTTDFARSTVFPLVVLTNSTAVTFRTFAINPRSSLQ